MPETNFKPYLSGEELGNANVKLKILTPHREIEKEFENKLRMTYEVDVKLPSEVKRVWSMSPKAFAELIRRWGSNTDTWVDKEVTVAGVLQSVFGKQRKVITIQE